MTAIELPRPVTHVSTAAGWHEDPHGQHQMRYFNGQTWTSHVTHYGPTPCAGCGSSDEGTATSGV